MKRWGAEGGALTIRDLDELKRKARLYDSLIERLKLLKEAYLKSAHEHADACSHGSECDVYKTKMHIARVIEGI